MTTAPQPTAPFDRERAKVLGSAEAAAFIGLSLPHFRRLYRLGKVPKGIQVGERKLGWQVGVLADFLDAKTAA